MKTYQNNLHSFNSLVLALEKLPTIGKKSAKKMAYTLAVENAPLGLQIAQAIHDCILEIRKCEVCGGLSNAEICDICLDSERRNGTLCIVSHPRDIFLIEDIGEFSGVYCVMQDYKEFDFSTLVSRIKNEGIEEVIFAFAPSLESDMLIMFIQEKLENLELRFSKIAQGVPQNISLDNVDNFSLARAFTSRVNA
ncbi:recombination protein RecR [Helicobacter saguini]|uniref:Recombination protein RecR n=1 Tax=Helicobacter saguini TaxID=1548018 RepID=A0A347VUA7_9HELI|nr:recombination mediator RecR [Helicobacter saguini]MWV62452.1 recombination protein RecR [Helicobacter saguini]MWV66875.1 recombination protein RecR [Helicobacter saguini]MWV69224.1 recombination protein RecR [Helicobacter saguini]MWV71221.1 recombination protein RecR [Helicobacter saguini]TLD93306.1 recombination protein RecR [Helicobacter saguini]